MQNAAEPGEILLTGDVREALADLYAFEARGDVEVRGRKLAAWRLARAQAAAGGA